MDLRVETAHAAVVRPPRPIRVFLAEDHDITLWGLSRLVDAAHPRMEVVGAAATVAGLLRADAVSGADVVVLDLNLGGEDSRSALAQLQASSPARVLVLTAADDAAVHRDAVMKGARGVVHKAEPADTILRAIEKVHAGEIWLHRALLGQMLNELTGRAPSGAAAPDPEARRIAGLTPREREIVRVMVQKSAAKQFAVADALGISEHTLRNHLTTIYGKLGVHGRLELHVYAVGHGLDRPPRPDA